MQGKINKTIICAFMISICILSCSDENEAAKAPIVNPKNNTNYSLSIDKNEDSTFAFSISKGEKKIIVQKNIPAAKGTKGFKTKKEAEKCGDLMIQKIKKNVWPPSLSIYELDSMRINY